MKNNTRILVLVAAAAVVAVLGGGWFLGVSPQLAAAAAADQSASAIDAQNQTLQVKLASLSKAAAKADDLQAKADVLYKAVPPALRPNTFIRRVNTVAAEDEVSVQSVAPGTAQAYTPPTALQSAATAPATGTAAAPSPTATPSTDAAAATSGTVTTATTAGAAPSPVTDPAITASNFVVVPMSVVVRGSVDHTVQFVRDIQQDERLFLVSGVSTATDETGTTATLTGYVYALQP